MRITCKFAAAIRCPLSAWSFLACLVLACLALPGLAAAQDAQLKLPAYADLKEKAIKSVDLTIDATTLGMMGWFMSDTDPDTAELKKTLHGVKSVQIRSYKFTSDFAYSQADVEAVRSQLTGPGWSQLVQVHDRDKNEGVDIYIAVADKIVKGFALIAADRREFTIVNIVGAVDLDQVARLRKTFGAVGSDM
jgi:Domain of unknown function (DUF4252)